MVNKLPIYLVSESADKLVFRTTVSNEDVYYPEETDWDELEIIYTLEKVDGEWVRTIEEA